MVSYSICCACPEYMGMDEDGWLCALAGDIADEGFYLNDDSDMPKDCRKKLEQGVMAGMTNVK